VVKLPDATKVDVRRYDALGIGFEIHGDRVMAAALYPAKKP
jgi:hypothetical protein